MQQMFPVFCYEQITDLSRPPTTHPSPSVRVVDEALDLTMAQNMALPVHLMATSGDTNKHLATSGTATYYDVRVLLVGAMYTIIWDLDGFCLKVLHSGFRDLL